MPKLIMRCNCHRPNLPAKVPLLRETLPGIASDEAATAVQPSHGASASKIDRDSSNLPHEAGASGIDRVSSNSAAEPPL